MATPYSTQTISGYNSSPPSDDGSQTASNEITWAVIKTKLPDPIKTLSEAINTELLTAFGLLFGQNFSTQSTTFNVVAGDQGKFFSVTGTSTANLGAAATLGAQFPILISNDGSGTVTIDPNGSETINGSATMALSPGECALITCDGSNWRGVQLLHTASEANARSALGLGSLSTASSVNNSNWSGTDLAIANGGTGASDAATALDNLGIDGASGVIAAGDLATGVGVWIPLSTIDISGSTYATFTNGSGGVVIDSTYDYYMLQWTNMYFSSSDTFNIQVGTSGGFITTTTYAYNSSGSGTGTTGQSYINLGLFTGSVYFDGSCFFRYPHTATRTILEIENCKHESTPGILNTHMRGMNETTTAIDRIRIGRTAGPMGSGTVTLFALKK